jgi:signal peptidase I
MEGPAPCPRLNREQPIMADMTQSLRCELVAESLRICGVLRLKVTGWSMLPTIWPGDILVISPAQHHKIVPGEIAVYRHNGRVIAHRVIATKSKVITQGDGVRHADVPVARHDLLGKVDFILRNGKKLEPPRQLRATQRAVAGLVRHSSVGARVIVGMRQLYDRCQS